MDTNTELKKDLVAAIEDAAFLKLSSRTEKPLDRALVNTHEHLTSEIETALYNLVYHADGDPGSDFYDYEYLLQDIIVLLGKPGIIEQLNCHCKIEATEKLNKLRSYINTLNSEHTFVWLDYFQAKDYSMNNKEIIEKLKYYSFEAGQKLNSELSSHYLTSDYLFEKQRFERMEKAYQLIKNKGGAK